MARVPSLPRNPDTTRFGFTSHHIDVGGLAMHVMERGHGQPVVMFHGNPTWGWLWRKVADLLPVDRFRVILPDLVGLGYSDRPNDASQHTLANHVGWMSTCLRQLDLNDAIVVAQDWGGPIGLGAIQAAGVDPAGIVLCNTVIGPPRKGFKATAFHRFARVPGLSDFVFRVCAFPQAMLGMAQGNRKSLWFDRAYMAPLADPRYNAAPLALARMVPDSDTHPSVGPLAAIEALVLAYGGPMALVWGERDPILGRVVNHLARQFPHASVTRTRGGHFLPEEEPRAIADAIVSMADAGPVISTENT